MFPAQTSLIPVQIALIRFLEAHGWQAIFANFPYWYLDSTPFRYLSGPILPIITISLHRVLPNLGFFPFVLIFYFRLIKQFQKKTAIFLILTITGLILLDTAIIPTLLFSMAIVFVSQTRWKRVEEKIKQTLIVLITALLIATLWYTPGYWLTLLTAPSLAGKSLFSVAISLPRLLSVFLALFFAFFSARF